MAPRVVVVFALILGTFTAARLPSLNQEKFLLRFIWKAALSMNTQLLVKSKSVSIRSAVQFFLVYFSQQVADALS